MTTVDVKGLGVHASKEEEEQTSGSRWWWSLIPGVSRLLSQTLKLIIMLACQLPEQLVFRLIGQRRVKRSVERRRRV